MLVVLSCGSLRLYCGSEVTVGCAGARPVNPLKLGYTLSTLNFRTCDHEDTLRLFFLVFFFELLFLVTVSSTMFCPSSFRDFQRKWKRCLIEIYIPMSVHIRPSTSWGLINFPDRFVDHYPFYQIDCQPPARNKNKFHPKADCVIWLCGDRKTQSIATCVCIVYKRYQGLSETVLSRSLAFSCGQNGLPKQLARPGKARRTAAQWIANP